MDENLLRASERVVQILEDISGIPTSRLVNISGRQRMLSQRMAKFYILISWGLKRPSSITELERAKNEFKGALSTLIEAPENTVNINAELEEAKMQWILLHIPINLDQSTNYPLAVSEASEKMLHIMERLTDLYEQVAGA